MRVLLSTYGSRGDVEPVAGLAVRLRELGAQVRVCAPPDEEFAALLARAPRTRDRAAAVAGLVRTDGTTVAATLLLDAAGRDRG